MSGINLRLAVTGNPVAHSRSPQIFRKFFSLADAGGFYSRIAADSIEEALSTARIAGIRGLNVTSPFKEDAAAMSVNPDEAVKKLKAANTLVIPSSAPLIESENADIIVSAFNTDYKGVSASVKKLFPLTEGKKAFVAGAGGAGIAAAYSLSLEGFDVTVFNRTFEKAVEKVSWIENCRAEKLDRINEMAGSADIIVNALPSAESFIETGRMKKGSVYFDANYRHASHDPSSAKFSGKGVIFISAFDWLVNQAGFAFEIFTGISPGAGNSDYTSLITEEELNAPDFRIECKNNISLIGFMGCGKTSAGRQLAGLLGRNFIDIDREIEKLEKMSISEIFALKGESCFRQIEKKITERVFLRENNQVISCGGGAVKENENRDIITANSYPVWLAASPSVSAGRISDLSRPLLNTDKKFEEAKRIFSERIDLYGMTASLIINSEIRGPLETAEKIYDEISFIFRN